MSERFRQLPCCTETHRRNCRRITVGCAASVGAISSVNSANIGSSRQNFRPSSHLLAALLIVRFLPVASRAPCSVNSLVRFVRCWRHTKRCAPRNVSATANPYLATSPGSPLYLRGASSAYKRHRVQRSIARIVAASKAPRANQQPPGQRNPESCKIQTVPVLTVQFARAGGRAPAESRQFTPGTLDVFPPVAASREAEDWRLVGHVN